MTIIFAIIAAVAIIAFGILLALYLRLRQDYIWLDDDNRGNLKYILKIEKQKESLEKEVTVLRRSNREGNVSARNERQKLYGRLRSAEAHAQSLQDFHLNNEQTLKHELAGAHALIEMLTMALPHAEVPTQTFEVQRLFRVVADAHPQNYPSARTKRAADLYVF